MCTCFVRPGPGCYLWGTESGVPLADEEIDIQEEESGQR
jgi:hypothetical protein